MKRMLFTFVLVLFSLTVWGQVATPLERAGTHIRINGNKLSAEEQSALLSDIGGTDYREAWSSAANMRNAGLCLTIGGGVATLGGLTTMMIGGVGSLVGAATGAVVGSVGGEEGASSGAKAGASVGKPLATAGAVVTLLGIAALGSGIPMLAVGGKRMNSIKDLYNNTPRNVAVLSFGPTASGVGIALTF